jgi:hypothetical protein
MSETTVKFIIQELTSWPIITIIIILLLLKPIRGIVSGINNIKVGDFQLSLQKIGESLGVPTSVEDISNLNYDDLKIFLIICGEDADYYYFKPTNMVAGRFKQILDNLATNGLITLFNPSPEQVANVDGSAKSDPNNPPPAPASPTFGFNTTEKGRKVHRALLDSIYEQLLHVKTVPGK